MGEGITWGGLALPDGTHGIELPAESNHRFVSHVDFHHIGGRHILLFLPADRVDFAPALAHGVVNWTGKTMMMLFISDD